MENEIKGLGFYEGNGIKFQDEEQNILENVKRVISTKRGERIGNLAFGSNVRRLLFMPSVNIDTLVQEIVNSLKLCEPRVKVIECTFTATKWDTVEIKLVIQVKKTAKILETTMEL